MRFCSIAAKITTAIPLFSPLLSIVETRNHKHMLSALPVFHGDHVLRGACPYVVESSSATKWGGAPEFGLVLLIFPQQIMDGDGFLTAAAALHGAPGISGSARTAAVSPTWHRALVVKERTAME